MEVIEVLHLVCEKLEQAQIPYMLTGSLAANFYAVPRMTRDIDIVIEILPENISAFISAFAEDFYINKVAIDEAISYNSQFNIIHHNSRYKIDFIVRKKSIYRSIEFQRKKTAQIANKNISIVSAEDLIISKLFWAKDSISQMQISDIKNLMQSVANLDKKYIREWINELQLNSIYNQIGID